MKRHRLPPENRMYRPFGRVVTTEISYQLPGLRIEQVQSERHTLVGLTAITPLDAKSSDVHQVFWWTPKWMTLVRPLLRHFAGSFLDQDRDVVVLQQEGLRHNPALLLIDDADTQAKWYFRVKREWLRAAEEGRAFENPLREKTLTWKS
jgi:phenylpropionate dioxygenase-like ring-hydroxylating dioxygenase large terminal subunit